MQNPFWYTNNFKQEVLKSTFSTNNVMVLGNRNSVVKRTGNAVANINESHWLQATLSASERWWLGNIYGRKRLSKRELHKWVLRGYFPSLRVWFKACWNEWKDFYRLKAFLNWTLPRFLLMKKSPQQMVTAWSGAHQLCLAGPSITCGPYKYISTNVSVLTLEERGQGSSLSKA